ncbi:MAG: DUF3299 domain-containing protein [bacterium]
MTWPDMVNPDTQQFDDPYVAMSSDQLKHLIEVAGLRAMRQSGGVIDANRLHELTRSLEADGLDIDYLIAQRWLVAEKRKLAATSGNVAIADQEVKMMGFVIPAPPDVNGESIAYLVPERGMCSHMPPPAPNQMVKLRLPQEWQPSAIYEPVELTGQLQIAPSNQRITVVDGLVEMNATYQMDVKEIHSANIEHVGHTHE